MSVEKPRRKRDWEGRFVRLRRTIENTGGAIFEEGEVLKVTRNFGGLHLEGIKRCAGCEKAYRRRITKINEGTVNLLPLDYQPEDKLL